MEVDISVSYPADEREADSDLRRYGEILKTLGIKLEDTTRAPCKGMMVIGTFRKTELSQRTNEDFSSALERAISTSKVCALTGLQLLGLLLRAQAYPETKDEIVKLLFDTNGVCKTPPWSTFLAVDKNTN